MKPLTQILLAALITTGLACAVQGNSEKAPEDGKAKEAESKPLSPADKLLQDMEARGKKIETGQADIDYEMNQTLLDDIQKRKGKVWYKKPNLFRLEFSTPKKETFVLDGRRLYEKRDASKQLIIYELRRADEKPIESLELGRSPFPMPFGQEAKQVKKHFTVALDTSAKKGKDQQVLVLVPKKKSPLARDYKKITFWVDTKTMLPTKVAAIDRSENILTVVFSKTTINKKLKKKLFERPRVGRDWEVIEHLKEPEEPKKADKTEKEKGGDKKGG